ncbi:hypothetical protein VKT23_015003 [Stygiomarasmius scandens]|uniref:Uncharacterized protein n=1 Tax=Marasmiellus scandens TaxID=2682957 RepID=A0ABR1J0C2_9AGAR
MQSFFSSLTIADYAVISLNLLLILMISLDVYATERKRNRILQLALQDRPQELVVRCDPKETNLEAQQESLLGLGSYKRIKVLKARAKRKSKHRLWLWSKPDILHREEQYQLGTSISDDIELQQNVQSQPPETGFSNKPDSDIELLVSCKDHLYNAFHQYTFWSEFIPHVAHGSTQVPIRVLPYDIRLLETVLGVPHIPPPGDGYSPLDRPCLFGRCNHDLGYQRFRQKHFTQMRVERLRRCARDYYALKKRGCLDRGHELGWEEGCFCEGRLGRSWARARKRCERIYQYESVAKTKDLKLENLRQAWRSGTLNAPNGPETDMIQMEGSGILSYEGITAIQLATYLRKLQAENNIWACMASGFYCIFGFSFREIWDKEEDLRDMVLFTCEPKCISSFRTTLGLTRKRLVPLPGFEYDPKLDKGIFISLAYWCMLTPEIVFVGWPEAW